MNNLKLNLDLSRKLVKDMECMHEHVGLKECYRNTFKAISIMNFLKDYSTEDYRVAYGFIDKNVGLSRMYFRHAFLVNKNEGFVVDVTACLWDDLDDEYQSYDYYVFKEYENLDVYVDDLLMESGLPALYEVTKEKEVAAVNKLNKKGMEYNPIDLMDLLHRVYGENFVQGFEYYKKCNCIVLGGVI